MRIQFENIPTNGIRLHTAFAGAENGLPVFLLHGFPEAWFGWEPQIEALAEAGFRVIAPDQRGYNLSDKPQGIENYRLHILADDILGLADALGIGRFYLAGHDWGALVSWRMAARAPDRIRKLVIANGPHPAVFRSYLLSHPSQMLKSWYAAFFQLPVLPEWSLKMGSWGMLLSNLPPHLTEAQRSRYREAWNQPGAMTAMLNWYRAAARKSSSRSDGSQITVPVRILWGKNDAALSYEMARLSSALCEDGEVVTYAHATHWVLHDEPEETGRQLVDYFSQGRGHR